MAVRCPIHGLSGVCIYSPSLLTLRDDGTLPDIVSVEIKDRPDQIAFFAINITAEEAKSYPIVNGYLPFDYDTYEIMERLPEMCGCCFAEQRKALESQQSQ